MAMKYNIETNFVDIYEQLFIISLLRQYTQNMVNMHQIKELDGNLEFIYIASMYRGKKNCIASMYRGKKYLSVIATILEFRYIFKRHFRSCCFTSG